ncbi:hypothetical protein ABZ733_38025 [Streptomyces longwoodensis]|uniref:hypothetical protein n=1 Tax=Streptomyces longwoodensis TaxID=68231 RepID=UPI0033F3F72C
MGGTGFTAEERAAMKERARETRGTRRAGGKADPEKEVKARYSTLGFNDPARLDDGAMWPTAFAVTPDPTADDEALISALVRRAAG